MMRLEKRRLTSAADKGSSGGKNRGGKRWAKMG
jgi:hypothetical protein